MNRRILICIVSILFVVADECSAQRSISSTFVERPGQSPRVFVHDVQYNGTYFLKGSQSYSWQSIPLNNLATINARIIQQELDLDEKQVAEFRKLERRFLEYADERLKLALEKIAEDTSIPGKKKLEPARKVISELQHTLNLQSDEEVKDLLVPTQFKRLNELRHQANQKRLGTAGYLLTPELIQKLGLSKEQINQIKSLNRNQDSSIRDKAWKLRGKLLQECMDVLSEKERGLLRKTIGKEFDWR